MAIFDHFSGILYEDCMHSEVVKISMGKNLELLKKAWGISRWPQVVRFGTFCQIGREWGVVSAKIGALQ